MLNDGNSVVINEETQNLLNTLLEDKYQIVEYMRESKQNFMRIIKEVT
jgi:predicted GNAT superfamily acetyltransferase